MTISYGSYDSSYVVIISWQNTMTEAIRSYMFVATTEILDNDLNAGEWLKTEVIDGTVASLTGEDEVVTGIAVFRGNSLEFNYS